MVSRGLDYVAWPTLNRPDETIFYDGPGFKSGAKGRTGVVNPLKGATAKKVSTNGYATGEVEAKPAPALQSAGRRGQAYHSVPS